MRIVDFETRGSPEIFRMIQIQQAKDDLAAKGLLVLLAHTSGLDTAGMRRRHIRAVRAVRVQSSSKRAQAISH
jgi:hypothetical protein